MIEFAQSKDYNQMLVVSAFVHFLILTVLLYLPKPTLPKKIVIPSISVDLIEIPTTKPGQRKPEQPAKASPKVKQEPPQKMTPPTPTVNKAKQEKPRKPTPPVKPERPAVQKKSAVVKNVQVTPKQQSVQLPELKTSYKKTAVPKIAKNRLKTQSVSSATLEKELEMMKVPTLKPTVKKDKSLSKEVAKLAQLPDSSKKRSSASTSDPETDSAMAKLNSIRKQKVASTRRQKKLTEPNKLGEETFNELETLKRKKVVPVTPKTRPGSQKSLLEESIKELQNIKAKSQALGKVTPAPVAPGIEDDDPLSDFESLKMKAELDSLDKEIRKSSGSSRATNEKDEEFKALARKKVVVSARAGDTSTSPLMDELEKLSKLNAVKSVEPSLNNSESTPGGRARKKWTSAPLESVTKKLGSIETQGRNVDIAVTVRNNQESIEFTSSLRNIKIKTLPETERKTRQIPEASKRTPEKKSATPIEGDPTPVQGKTISDPDALTAYIQIVQSLVMANWKDPIGAKNKKEVLVSFQIFRAGNVKKTKVEKSSGEEKLDSIARRAVMDAEPFPEFPDALKEPSLNVSIKFKYVPEKK